MATLVFIFCHAHRRPPATGTVAVSPRSGALHGGSGSISFRLHFAIAGLSGGKGHNGGLVPQHKGKSSAADRYRSAAVAVQTDKAATAESLFVGLDFVEISGRNARRKFPASGEKSSFPSGESGEFVLARRLGLKGLHSLPWTRPPMLGALTLGFLVAPTLAASASWFDFVRLLRCFGLVWLWLLSRLRLA